MAEVLHQEAINTPLPECTMYEYIWLQNKEYLNNIALDYYDKKISYKELFENIDRVAESFIAIGVKIGEIVSIIAVTTPELIYAIYALNKIGAVCNMLDPRMSADTIRSLVENAESKYMIVMNTFADKVKNDLAIKMKIILMNTDATVGQYSFEYIKWNEFVDFGKDRQIHNAFLYKKDFPALIEYTGGTTGEPKGVVLSNDNVNAVAKQYKMTGIELLRSQSWQTVSASFITYALVFSMHVPLSYGMICKLIIYDPQTIALDSIRNEYNHIAANPLVWDTIIHHDEAQNRDFSYLISPITGADYMSKKLEMEINDFLKIHGCKRNICQGYGLTETASGVSINLSNDITKLGSVGIPFINTVISIFSQDSCEELTYGNIGEICISGPSLMLGYLKNEQATKDMIKTHSDGSVWLHSGDLGYMDKDGFLYIEGRIKRMFVRYNGAKVFPPVIEKVIMKHMAVKKCIVVGKQDPENSVGQVPAVFIILNSEFEGKESAVEEELKALCDRSLPDYEKPCDWRFIDKFPITLIGKVDYLTLEKMANAERKN